MHCLRLASEKNLNQVKAQEIRKPTLSFFQTKVLQIFCLQSAPENISTAKQYFFFQSRLISHFSDH